MVAMQIVGIGLTTIDILMRLSQMPTWEAGGRIKELRIDGGGPVGTGLAAAARMGVRTGFIGTCGSDASARLKLDLLAQEGIDVSRVVRRPGNEQQVILCYVHEQTGERLFSGAEGDQVGLSPEELDRDYITAADYLLLDGFHHPAALQAAHWMHAAGKKVMLDGSKVGGWANEQWRESMCELVSVTDLLICGSGFAPAMTGKCDIWEAGRSLLAFGPQIVVMTEGEQGSYTVTATECFHTPAYSVPVVDTTGAGDVFHGAYLVGQIKGWNLRHTACFATAVSAIKCTRMGGRSGIPCFREVADFLHDHGEAWL